MVPESFRLLFIVLLALFIVMNIVACFHALKFTRFATDNEIKTGNAGALSFTEKLKTLVIGVNNPRPINTIAPHWPYRTVKLKSNKEIECWEIPNERSKGTVILFHGFSGAKSGMLDKAEVFRKLGYNTFLVDFMGSGGSEGNQTTIGYNEAQEVKTAYDHIRSLGEQHIFLFGTSMGAVSIMKALHDYSLSPEGIIIECPFGTMIETVQARFASMKVPAFPMAYLLVFWGGIQNGFNAFGHNPVEYANRIKVPTLLLHGQKDDKVSIQEINRIYTNLKGPKSLKIYAKAAHESYLLKHPKEWTRDVNRFLALYTANR